MRREGSRIPIFHKKENPPDYSDILKYYNLIESNSNDGKSM